MLLKECNKDRRDAAVSKKNCGTHSIKFRCETSSPTQFHSTSSDDARFRVHTFARGFTSRFPSAGRFRPSTQSPRRRYLRPNAAASSPRPAGRPILAHCYGELRLRLGVYRFSRRAPRPHPAWPVVSRSLSRLKTKKPVCGAHFHVLLRCASSSARLVLE